MTDNQKENINPTINKSSGYFTQKSFACSGGEALGLSPKRPKQTETDFKNESTSSSKAASSTSIIQEPNEPNAQILIKLYKKTQTFLSYDDITDNDLFDKMEQCFSQCQQIIKNESLVIWNIHDYGLLGEILILVASTQIRAKYLDNLNAKLALMNSIQTTTKINKKSKSKSSEKVDSESELELELESEISDLKIEETFKYCQDEFKRLIRERIKKEGRTPNIKIRVSKAQNLVKSIVEVSTIQAKIDIGQEDTAKKLILLLIKTPESSNRGSKLLYSFKHERSENCLQMPECRPLIHACSLRYEAWITETLTAISEAKTQQKLIEQALKFKLEQDRNSSKGIKSIGKDVLVVNGKSYLKLRILGRGGYSKVYKVFDQEKSAEYALKVIDCEGGDSAIISSYENEVEALQILDDCDNIIKMIDYQVTPEKRFLVLECGETDLLGFIRERISQERKLVSKKDFNTNIQNKLLIPLAELKTLFSHMVRAVNSMHSNGMIHLDLKPANFILARGIVKLIDFGISNRLPSKEATSFNNETSAGTPNYMAPEQLTRQKLAGKRTYKVGKKTDVWALGCILHYMAFSETPYHSIENQREKFAALCDIKQKVPIKQSQFEVLNKFLEEKILVKDVQFRATTEQVLADEFFNEEASMNVSNFTNNDLTSSIAVPTNVNSPKKCGGLNSKLYNQKLVDLTALTPGTRKSIKSLLERKGMTEKKSTEGEGSRLSSSGRKGVKSAGAKSSSSSRLRK